MVWGSTETSGNRYGATTISVDEIREEKESVFTKA